MGWDCLWVCVRLFLFVLSRFVICLYVCFFICLFVYEVGPIFCLLYYFLTDVCVFFCCVILGCFCLLVFFVYVLV